MAMTALEKTNQKEGTEAIIVTSVAVFRNGQRMGLEARSPLELISVIGEGLAFSDFESLRETLELSASQLASVIRLPASTLARKKKSGRLTPDQSERLLRVARITEMAFDLFEGNAPAARLWLKAPHEVLGGNTPLEMLATDIGAREVENLIGRLQDGVFS